MMVFDFLVADLVVVKYLDDPLIGDSGKIRELLDLFGRKLAMANITISTYLWPVVHPRNLLQLPIILHPSLSFKRLMANL